MDRTDSCNRYPNHKFNEMGHNSGIGFLKKVKELLRKRNQDQSFRCDSPTESKGNCYPYALMQQLHLPKIYDTLSDETKGLCDNYHDLRVAIVAFVKNIDSNSQYFTQIDEGRTQNALMQIEDISLPTWEDQLAMMSRDGTWFDDQFIRFSAFYLQRDIIIHTSTQDMKYCGSPDQEEGDVRVEHLCTCRGPSIHIANIGNYHFQSILAAQCVRNPIKIKEIYFVILKEATVI